MDAKEKLQIMDAISQNVIDLIQKRQASRVKALDALGNASMENLPDEVKKMREIEAGKIRAVMQEQTDLIEIIQAIFPKVPLEVKGERNKRQ